MATLQRGQTFGATETVTNTKLHSLVDDGAVSGIVNADCDNAMALANSKLANLVDSGKVGGTSLFGLASIPSGAGDIPSEQMQTNALVLANVSQSISGFKNFSTIPSLPSSDPDSDDEAVRKKYADDRNVVASGTVSHGATIPFPTLASGRVSGDYTWVALVSPNSQRGFNGAGTSSDWEIDCSESSLVVTCRARIYNTSGVAQSWVNGTANYILIGVLN